MEQKFPYSVRVAIDFDNTIVNYDDLFLAAARERNLVSSAFRGTTHAVRDAVRCSVGETEWQDLQAHVYGELIDRAPPFPGVREFILRARQCGARVAIVSHKTPFAAARPSGPNLREAARRWLVTHGMLGSATVAEQDVYFESTRHHKVSRIRALDADIAIDDLAEVLTDTLFPARTRRWLFAPSGTTEGSGALECFTTWHAMQMAFELRCGGEAMGDRFMPSEKSPAS